MSYYGHATVSFQASDAPPYRFNARRTPRADIRFQDCSISPLLCQMLHTRDAEPARRARLSPGELSPLRRDACRHTTVLLSFTASRRCCKEEIS